MTGIFRLYNQLTSLGVSATDIDYKKSVIRITNSIALVFFAAGLIYGAISIFLAPQLVDVCIILFIGSALIFGLNYLQMVDVSRLLFTLLISLDVAIYHGYLVQAGEPLIISIYIGQFVVAILPWIYIDIREKWLLPVAVLISFSVFLLQPWTNELLAIEMDSKLFRENIFSIPTLVFSIGALLYCMYLLQQKNVYAAKQATMLLENISKRNQEMEAKQEQILKLLDENTKATEAQEKRRWIANGLSQLGGTLRGTISDKFYHTLVAELVDFMKITQAGIYVVEEEHDEKIIDMKSCYAFDRNKFLKKKIEIGQGLVGQCYLEKASIFLKEVPESYLYITSGLGDTPPRCILLVPMIHENTVEGIIELASLRVLDDHEIEFAEKFASLLASFVASNRINQRTKILLEKFQIQSEELRSQEEEMRQNMEEMQATQEEMHRKEQEYVQRISELENDLGLVASGRAE